MSHLLPQDEFVSALKALPLVLVDLVVVNPQGLLLWGQRCLRAIGLWI